ncbi:MAG: PAS domain S-box protein, partial [bacterium]
ELSTVNEQLQHRNLELNQTTNDLQNLLASTAIPVVMVGPDLRIRRLTPPARKIMNLLSSDLGRPIGDLKANVDVPDLEALIAEVVEEVQFRERDVRGRDGCWYTLRIYPYRTFDNRIDGAVVVLLDIDDIKRYQEAVREERDYAQAIVETIREPLIILDGELRVETANAAFYRTFGVQPAETQERLVYELGDQQWKIPALRRLLERVLPHDQAFEGFEVQHHFPQIGHKTMLLNARRLYRAERPSLILLAIEDVTERAEAASLRLTAIVDSSDDAIVGKTLDGVVTSWNRAAERMFGYTAAEAIGQPITIIIPPEHRPEEDYVLSRLREGEAAHFETVRMRKDGTRLDISLTVSPIKDAAGHVIGASKIARDITERKRAEAALRASEERLSLAVRGTGMGTWDVDLKTDGVIWSENHFRVLGYEPAPGGEATMKMWRERIHPDDREGVLRALDEAKRERTLYASEYRICRADDGETRWLSACGRYVYDEAGEAQRFVGIFNDITERREAKALSSRSPGRTSASPSAPASGWSPSPRAATRSARS